MIVKNEEDVLSRALECAKKFADEIVIVDTGSTDKTKEIARKFTDKVFDFKWCDDFSKARNFAFSLATCDYQMWLDADDFVTDENIKKIVTLKNSSANADVFMCKYVFGNLTYFRERILKRERNFKWQGFVHEVISPFGKIEYTDIEIEHRKTRAGDPKRNLRLYQNALKKGAKFSPREQYYYARELFYGGQFEKAITTFRKFLKMKDLYGPDVLGAHLLLAECQEKIGTKDAALSTLFDALKSCTPTSELCCKIAYLFEKENMPSRAVFWFRCALCCEKQTSGFVQRDFEELVPCIELSRLLYFSDKDEAKTFHERAKKISPENQFVKFNEKFFSKE